MKKYNNYSALYKLAYAIGKENEIIPKPVRLRIPKQTIYYWRRLSQAKIDFLKEEIQIKGKLHNCDNILMSLEYQKHKNYELSRIQKRFNDFIGKEGFKVIIESKKEQFIKLVESYSGILHKKDLLNWYGIEKKAYDIWLLKARYKCTSSNVSLCAKRFPQQVTPKEYSIIEKSLYDSFYDYWPKSAIHADLVRKNLLSISRSTYYKYASLIKPHWTKRRRRKNYKPLRANKINEYWHFDISYFKIRNNKKVYIYALIDNFSRKILAWKCELKVRSTFVQEMLENALGKDIYKELILVSDGGTENTAMNIKELLFRIKMNSKSKVVHQIALKDIRYSNSMIERFFRTMKYDYPHLIRNCTFYEIRKNLDKLINEYNFIRPHYANGYLTPDEAYRGQKQPNLCERFYESQQERNKTNRNCSCSICNCT